MLIGLEIFVIPGFGIAGIAGIALTIVSLALIMLNNDAFDFEFVPINDIALAFSAAVGGLLGGVVLLFVGGARLANTRLYKRVALTDTQESSEGYNASFNPKDMKGKKGVAETVLRPSGKVSIEGQLYDAFTRGEYVEKGQYVEVLSETGSSLQVKPIEGK